MTTAASVRPLAVPIRSGAPVDAAPRADSTGSPWPVGWLVSLLASTLLGLAAILTGWYGASGEGLLAEQVPWLNLAVAGGVIAGLGNSAWLLRGRRSVGELRRALLLAQPAVAPAAPLEVEAMPLLMADWVQADGMRKVHRPDCPMVAGKPVLPVDPAGGAQCAICAGSER